MECRAHGTLQGYHVIVEDLEEARCLYGEGFYGHPLGVDKPRGADFTAPLLLTPLEAVYLAYKGVLTVYSGSSQVGLDRLEELAREYYGRLYDVMREVYFDLREKGLVVRSGLVYGADFTVYRYGPGIDHAPYVAHVYERDEDLEPTELVRAGRLSHSVRKTFIVASRDNSGRPIYLMLKWFRP